MSDRLTAETLCDRISREVLRHGIDWNDGDPRCYCGGLLPTSWDQHIAESLAAVFAPELTGLATRAAQAEATLAAVRTDCEEQAVRKVRDTTIGTGWLLGVHAQARRVLNIIGA